MQTQKDNVVIINQVDATIMTYVADTTLVVIDPTDPVVQPAAVSQPLSQAGPNRFAAAYPWGMPHTYNS